MTPDKTSGASVSVVIPTKGRPELLRRAISSVLAQEYDGTIECIVVHDGEDPAPGEALTSGRRRVIALRNDRTPGAAGARNCGFLQATGEYLALCDDDDLWLPGKLATQIAQLAREPEAIGSGGGFLLRQGERTTVKTPQLTRVTHADLLRSRVADVHPSTLVFRRERLLERAGLLDEQVPGSYGEDYDWLLRASRVGKVGAVQEVLADIRKDVPSWFRDRWINTATALEYLLEKHPDFRDRRRGHARMLGQIAYARAAAGERRRGARIAGRALTRHPVTPHAWLALAVAGPGIQPRQLLTAARRLGRGLS